MDEFGFNENQLATLLSLLLSSEHLLHERRTPIRPKLSRPTLHASGPYTLSRGC